MSNILKLVLLDKAMLKPYYKYFLVVILAPVVMSISYKDILYGMLFCMCITAMTSVYTFQVAEKNDINKLYGLLPVSKKDIVSGRYLFTAILGMLAIGVSLLLNLLLLTIVKVPFSSDKVLAGTCTGIILYYFMTAIQLPGYFRFGSIKGRLFSYLPLIVIASSGFVINRIKVLQNIPEFILAILQNPFGMISFAILISIVFYGVSIGISQRIYEKMEM